MELILCWDVCDQVLGKMKDIQILQVSGRVGHASFPGRRSMTVYDNLIKMASSRRPSRPDQTLQNMDFTSAWNQKGANNVSRLR